MHGVSTSENTTNASHHPQVAALSQVLLDSIPDDKRHQDAYRVLHYLARKTRAGDSDNAFARVPTKDIYADLEGNPNSEPAKWLNQIWRNVEGRVFPQLRPALIRRSREQGLLHYPTVGKTTGNPAYYFLDAEPLPEQPPDVPSIPLAGDAQPGALAYEPDLTLQLSRRGKLLFENGLILDRRKRLAMAAWTMFLAAGVAAATSLLWFVLASDKSPISMSHLAAGFLMIALPWILCRRITGMFRLLDDRIGLAPEWMLHWKESGATVEILNGENADAPRRIQVLRYTAACPVCGAMVKLDRGEPDFPRRLVGRCEDSPREHVFSFDRITRSGAALVVPPVTRRTSIR
jgi:hypothetical protein